VKVFRTVVAGSTGLFFPLTASPSSSKGKEWISKFSFGWRSMKAEAPAMAIWTSGGRSGINSRPFIVTGPCVRLQCAMLEAVGRVEGDGIGGEADVEVVAP